MRRRLNLILCLAAKDIRLFLADKRAALFCFLVPILLASAFGMIFHRPHSEEAPARLVVLIVDKDHSSAARAVIAELQKSDRVELREVDPATAETRIRKQTEPVAIVLPSNFSACFETDSESKPLGSVLILHHPPALLEAQLAEGLFTAATMRTLANDRINRLALPTSLVRLDTPFQMKRVPVGHATCAGFNAYSHSFSGMTIQYLLFWGMESGLLFLRERRRGIWSRLQTAPIPIVDLLLGRASATALIALVQVLTTFAFGALVFGVAIEGSFAAFLLLAGAVSLLAAATGLLTATIGGTEARARSVCVLVILTVSMIGGLWLPMFLLPSWLQKSALLLPTTWAMRSFDGVTWQGHSFQTALPAVLVLYSFALIFLTLALGRFFWTEARRRRGIES